jgi:hypothetical protein
MSQSCRYAIARAKILQTVASIVILTIMYFPKSQIQGADTMPKYDLDDLLV